MAAARVVRHTARVVAVVIACLAVAVLLAVEARYDGIASGRARAQATSAPVAWAASAAEARSPQRAVEAAYLSEAAAVAAAAGAPSEREGASAHLMWDDRWLLADSRVYNHDLARACAVLAAVCNAESCWYSGAEGARPFAEEALGGLGFSRVRTDSYAWRSSLLDEVGAFLTGSHEGVAYTFAAKEVDPAAWEDGKDADGVANVEGSPAMEGAAGGGDPDAAGAGAAAVDGDGPVILVFVGVRGSYGFEWLTNFNLGEGPDHDGYRAAKADLARALADYLDDLGADPARTRVLVTGHSRGGAVANLLAAGLDDLAGTSQAVAPASGVFAYTFASPAVSRFAGEGCHGNIFNVVSEGDVVPRLPLASWGYARHGITVTIPRSASQEPEAEAAFLANTGVRFDAQGARVTAAALDALEIEVAELVAASGPVPDPRDLAEAAGALAALSPADVLAAHYPDAYIAWLQALEAEDLAFGA